ncbi:hypothetical protein CEE86_12995, partial [Lactobacillus crispatus]
MQRLDIVDHVAGMAGMEFANRDHGGIERIDAARHNRLQRGDELRADHHGIDAFVRPRRVAAEPFDVDIDLVGGGHDRAGADRERADRNPRTVV